MYTLYIYIACYFNFLVIQCHQHTWMKVPLIAHSYEELLLTLLHHYNNSDKIFHSIVLIYRLLGWTLPMNDPFELSTAVLVTYT